MQNPFIKKTLLFVLGLIMIVSLLVVPGVNQNVSAASTTFYVATNGNSHNDGSKAHPWDLQTALNQPKSVRPGAVIYVQNGTYKGSYTSRLKGSSSGYITVRNYAGQRVVLVNNGSPALSLDNSYYVNFFGLEITGPNTKRSTSRSESTYGIRVNQGASSNHINFINMVIHDVQAQGMGWWQALKDSTVYGCVIYNNGTTQLDHGVYVHNTSGTKIFRNNIVFDNASHGFHGYAETNEKGLNNLTLDGNTFFNNGAIGVNTSNGKYGTYKRNILVGGLIPANNAVIQNNYTYYPGSSGDSLDLGYSAGSVNAKVLNNYFAGGSFKVAGKTSGLKMTGNTVYAPGGVYGVGKLSGNTWASKKPTDVKFFVRANSYEKNRANITIYNWAKKTTVVIPASALNGVTLKSGQSYELHNVQNYFGDVVTGKYDGKGISVPMTKRSVAQPTGLGFKPASTFPEFGVFVLIAK